jgi:hypothetical protein
MDEFADQTVLHPLGLLAVVALGAAMLLVPRRYAVFPMMVMACFISPAQRVSIATLDFTLLRIMVVFGWVRILARSESTGLRWCTLDTLMVAWAACGTAAYALQRGDFGAIVFKAGTTFDALGMYFLFRCLIRTWEDVDAAVTGVVAISVPIALAFVIEHATRHNLFAFFGGVAEMTVEREGKMRCQGAFAHPILAGCFWASLLPLIATQWWRSAFGKLLAVTGLAMSAIIILACASSTPIMATAFGLTAATLFPLRRHMRAFRWGVLIALVGLQFVMARPVWHLMARVDVVGGSTGWHRFSLIDEAISRFPEWWLVGVKSTTHWGRGLFDITNHYVLEGVRGGVLTLVLFVVVIAGAFRHVGRLRRSVEGHRYREMVAWALGVGLFVHATNFMAVSYFGQIFAVWYLNLAVIGSLASAAAARRPARAGTRARKPAAGARERPLVAHSPVAPTPAAAEAVQHSVVGQGRGLYERIV